MNKKRLFLALIPMLLTIAFVFPIQNCAAQTWEELTKRGHNALGRYDLKGAQSAFDRANETAQKNSDNAQIAKTKLDLAELAFEKSKPAIISPKMSPTSVILLQLFAFFLILKYCVSEERQGQPKGDNTLSAYAIALISLILLRSEFSANTFLAALVIAVIFLLTPIIAHKLIEGRMPWQKAEGARSASKIRGLAKVSLLCSCAMTIVGILFALTVVVTTAKEAKVIQASNLQKSEQLLTESIQNWRRVKATDTKDEVLMYTNYASLYDKLNKPEIAAANLQRAVIIAKRSSKEIH